MRSIDLFTFPDPVNEVAARTVAAGVVLLTGTYLISGSVWVLAAITYGFVARVLAGPTLSPLGQLATRVIVPRLGRAERPVPGPPKRFAQAIGATLSLAALAADIGGLATAPSALIALVTGAAFLEAALGFCLGCTIFGRLMTVGLVPQSVCEACNDLSKRLTIVTSSPTP